MLSTIATQLATALDNAILFENINRALQTIENRERYQAGVARAVSQLTELGSGSLKDVLESLGIASQAHQVVFGQITPTVDRWTIAVEWISPEPSDAQASLLDISIPVSYTHLTLPTIYPV